MVGKHRFRTTVAALRVYKVWFEFFSVLNLPCFLITTDFDLEVVTDFKNLVLNSFYLTSTATFSEKNVDCKLL